MARVRDAGGHPRRSLDHLDANHWRARRRDGPGSSQSPSTTVQANSCACVLPYVLLGGLSPVVSAVLEADHISIRDTDSVCPALWPDRVSDRQYVQRIRKHKPSSLLPKVAAAACHYQTRDQWIASPYRIYTPWALADVARVALASGTEFNRSDATDHDLEVILAAYDALDDPLFRDKNLHAFMLRKAGEQLTWQSSDFHAMARTVALFIQTSSTKQLQCLIPGWDLEVLGYPLTDYIGTAQLIWASAINCFGFFDPEFFATSGGALATQHVAKETVLNILNAHFATNTVKFRAEERLVAERITNRNPQLRRYTYNPLRGRPVLTDYGDGYFCPIPKLIPAKVGPWGMYFTAQSHFGNSFTNDLGHVFESYIGRHLQLIRDANVIPEITYTENKSEARGTDWIVVFDDLVLLVEVKSAIPTEPVRLGTPDAAAEITKKIKKAYEQIDKTAALIRSRHPAFRIVPTGRSILGMTVTLEPFHLGNDPNFRKLLPSTQTRISLVDAAEIEALVTINDIPIGTLLLQRDADIERSTWSLTDFLLGHGHDRNPILDMAWAATPWALESRKYS